jgi:DNA-binding transcriptional ArsR family regulator
MVKYSLDRTFAALSDPHRRRMVELLARGEMNVSDLAQSFPMSMAAVSKHVGVLASAGIVVKEARGRQRRCRLAARPLSEAEAWVARYAKFWNSQLDSLAAHLKSKGTKK